MNIFVKANVAINEMMSDKEGDFANINLLKQLGNGKRFLRL